HSRPPARSSAASSLPKLLDKLVLRREVDRSFIPESWMNRDGRNEMGRTSRAAWWLVAMWLVATGGASAQTTPPANRALRGGNVNVLTLGGGYASFDHPNFDDHSFPAIAYQRRVLRREMRQFPLWLRAAFQFHAEDEKCHGNCYTVWTIDPG